MRFKVLLIIQYLIPKILMETVLYVHARGVKKINFGPDVVMMHFLQKIFMEEYMCWYAHGEQLVSHEIMLERILKNINSKNED
jgi:hypothetical protein